MSYDATFQLPDKAWTQADTARFNKFINEQGQAFNRSGVIQHTAQRRAKPKPAAQDLAIQDEKSRAQAERNQRHQAQILAQSEAEQKKAQAEHSKARQEDLEMHRQMLSSLE